MKAIYPFEGYFIRGQKTTKLKACKYNGRNDINKFEEDMLRYLKEAYPDVSLDSKLIVVCFLDGNLIIVLFFMQTKRGKVFFCSEAKVFFFLFFTACEYEITKIGTPIIPSTPSTNDKNGIN